MEPRGPSGRNPATPTPPPTPRPDAATDNSLKGRVQRALNEDRACDAGRMILDTIKEGRLAGLPVEVTLAVARALVNDRGIQGGSPSKEDRKAGVICEDDVLSPIVMHLAPRISDTDRRSLFTLALQRGKVNAAEIIASVPSRQ